MKRLTILGPVLAILALSACQTMQGAGRDISSAGQTLTQESERVEQGM